MRVLNALLFLGLVCSVARADDAKPAVDVNPGAAVKSEAGANGKVPAQAGAAAQPGTPAIGAGPYLPRLPLTDCEVGQEGYLDGIKIHSIVEDRFVGYQITLANGMAVPTNIAIFQKMHRRFREGQFLAFANIKMKCVGTEALADGRTVCVFEPVAPVEGRPAAGKGPRVPLTGPPAEGMQRNVVGGKPVIATPAKPGAPGG